MDTEQKRRSGDPRRNPDPRKRSAAPHTDPRQRQKTGRDQTTTRKRETASAGRPRSGESTSYRRPHEAEPAAARKRPKTGTGTREAERRPPSRRRSTTSGTHMRRRRKRTEAPKPEIIYTPPKPFSRNRFLLRLVTVAAVVLAVTFVFSIFFKVRTVTVSGADLYTPWEIREASGITEGDNLLTFGQVRAGAKIKATLPYVDTVRVGIKLPDTVNIEVVERDVVYSVQAQDNSWWLITAEGLVVEQTDSAEAGKHTKVMGIRLAAPLAGLDAAAAEETVPETPESSDPSDPSTPVTVTGAQRLSVALQILGALEENGFAGTAASVDVSNINSLIVWYGTRYEVRLGDTTGLDYKIRCMKDVISRMSEHQSGTLDISFTTWENQVGYTPFD